MKLHIYRDFVCLVPSALEWDKNFQAFHAVDAKTTGDW